MKDLAIDDLRAAVAGRAAAFRCRRRLEPAGGPGTRVDPEVDVAARTTLAALGSAAATLAFEAGADLRSRCLLWPDGPMIWELLDRPGEEHETYSLTTEGAVQLLDDAVEAALQVGLPWPAEPIVLEPSQELVKLVRLSQQEAAKGPVEAS